MLQSFINIREEKWLTGSHCLRYVADNRKYSIRYAVKWSSAGRIGDPLIRGAARLDCSYLLC
jgi:hypothetical protein